MKTCTTCGVTKSIDQFNKDKQKKDGLNPRCKECSRKWHHANKERVKEYQKKYYSETKQYHSEKAKRYRAENRDRLVESSKKWHEENKDRVKEYRESRKDDYMAHHRNRRARIKGCSGTHTKADIDRLLVLQGKKCAICNSDLGKYHIDHIVPIAKGGDNDFYNLQILCPKCNMSKSDTDPIEYNQLCGKLI